MAQLLELPNGGWVRLDAVSGIVVLTDKEYGPRVILYIHNKPQTMVIQFDNEDAAYGWAAAFGHTVNACHVQDL